MIFLFYFEAKAQENSIIISEIFADPTPSKGLFEKEFIEIFNATQESINLGGFLLQIGQTKSTFPDSAILPNQYTIICKKGNESDFAKYGKVLGVTYMSLLNSGETLKILNLKSESIYEVEYRDTWYSKGNDQGYSLEMIDLNYPCVGQSNWTSSISTLGATPGKINSVSRTNPDIVPPQLISTNVINFTNLDLQFDENMKKSTLLNSNNFSISPNTYKIGKLDLISKSEVQINLNQKIALGDEVILSIKNLQDCSGNVMESKKISFYNLSPADSSDIVISELLSDPKTCKDFIEIYNRSDKKINLKGLQLANKDSKSQTAAYSKISKFDLILDSHQYLALTTDTILLKNDYAKTGNLFQMPKLPTYNIDQGTVVLLNEKGNEFDIFPYNQKMHNQHLINTKGVSYEKVNLDKPSFLWDNWRSSTENVGYATPGYENSNKESESLKNEIYNEPIVFNPFQGQSNSETIINLKLIEPGYFASIDIYDKNGMVKRNLLNNSLLGMDTKISWDGKNNAGEILPVGYYLIKIQLHNSLKVENFLLKAVIASYE